MTLGEKIREARRKCGLSQEQLAERLSVSRSAIAKWETDKGLPDVGNLKILARLLNVSMDHLLDETKTLDELVIREAYQLSAYGYGCKRVRKDRAVRSKFPDAVIYPLLARQELAELPALGNCAPDCRTSPPDRMKNTDKTFYLIEKDARQWVATVTDVYMEIAPLEQPLEGSSFRFRGWNFIKYNYALGK